MSAWYNKFSPSVRAAKSREIANLKREGRWKAYTGSCMLCGDPDSTLEPHSENYAAGIAPEPPNLYWLCRNCHRQKLHKRFDDPARWQEFMSHVERGGYAREFGKGAPKDPSGKAIRPRDFPLGKWWRKLSMNSEDGPAGPNG